MNRDPYCIANDYHWPERRTMKQRRKLPREYWAILAIYLAALATGLAVLL